MGVTRGIFPQVWILAHLHGVSSMGISGLLMIKRGVHAMEGPGRWVEIDLTDVLGRVTSLSIWTK